MAVMISEESTGRFFIVDGLRKIGFHFLYQMVDQFIMFKEQLAEAVFRKTFCFEFLTDRKPLRIIIENGLIEESKAELW